MATFKKIDRVISETKAKFADVSATINEIKNNRLPGFDRSKFPNIVDIRPGYKVSGGKLKSDTKAIVFTVNQKVDTSQLAPDQLIPSEINGIPTDVTTASVFEKLKINNQPAVSQLLPGSSIASPDFVLDSANFDLAASGTRGIPTIQYTPPPNVHLDEITEPMTLICHVSPEQGWIQLQKFLKSVTGDLTVGMFDFSAPQIDKALVAIAERDVPFFLCYDGKPAAGVGSGNKKDDLSENQIISDVQSKTQTKFEHVKASLSTKNGLWANAYHIKVAVNNQQSFWLSSGNWQSSNQPVIDPAVNFSKYLDGNNREWHIIVANKKLAKMYHDFLIYDLEQSQIKNQEVNVSLMAEEMLLEMPDFSIAPLQSATKPVIKQFKPKTFTFTADKPLRIQPLLTPDNYMAKIQPLIESAKSVVYFQNQYITVNKNATDEFMGLFNALMEKSKDPNIDCRIILRNEPNARLMKENLVSLGIPEPRIRIQDNCHNKGIIIDGKVVVLGSHNWSNYGVEWNRDASLIIYDSDVCAYYRKVFEYDWDNRATVKLNENNNPPSDELMGLVTANAQRPNFESLFD